MYILNYKNNTILMSNSVNQASSTFINNNNNNGFFQNLIKRFFEPNTTNQNGLNESNIDPNFVFCLVFLFLIIAGIISNIIVTLTYKFCDKKTCNLNPSTNLNLNHRISIRNDDKLTKTNSLKYKSLTNRRNTTTYGKPLPNTNNFNCNENSKNLLVPQKRRVSIANESQIDENHKSLISDNFETNLVQNNLNKKSNPKTIMSSSKLLNSPLYKSNNNTFLNDSTNNSQATQNNINNNNNTNPLTHNQNLLLSLTPLGTYNSAYNRMKRCSYFILSLGCCDLFICLLNMPLNLIIQSGYFQFSMNRVFKYSLYSDVWCKLAYFFIQIPIVLEIEILLTIAIDRYTSVFHPMNINVPDKLKFILILQIFISSILSLPNFLFYVSSDSLSDLNKSLIHSNVNNPKNNINKTNFYSYLTYSSPALPSNHMKEMFKNQKNELYSSYSLATYCMVKNNYMVMYNYYQIGLFALFVINLVIISVCYLRVYKHVYKASKNQRRESMATNSSLIQLPYHNQNWQSSSLLSPNFSKHQILNSNLSIGKNFESQSEKSYNLYSKNWLFCCKKLINKGKYEDKLESIKNHSLSNMIDAKKRTSYQRKSTDSRMQEKSYTKINKENVLDEVDENDCSNEDKKFSMNKVPLFDLCDVNHSENHSNVYDVEISANNSNEKELENEIIDKFDDKKQLNYKEDKYKLSFNHARRTSCPVGVDCSLRDALLKTDLIAVPKKSGSINSIYDKTSNNKERLFIRKSSTPCAHVDNDEENTKKVNNTEMNPTNIVHQNRSNSIKYLKTNTSVLMNRIRRFSENPNSSILLKANTNVPYTPSQAGFISPTQNSRTMSSSLFELNSNNGTLSNRVSIRKHTSRPLRHSKTARVLGVATLAFALTWSPYWYCVFKSNRSFKLNLNVTGVDDFNDEFSYIKITTMTNYLSEKFLKNSFYLNYVLNPLFYSFVNERFRRNVWNLFRKFSKCVFNIVCCCFLINKKFNSNKKSNFYCSSNNNSNNNNNNNKKIRNKPSRSRLNSAAKSDTKNANTQYSSSNNFINKFSKNHKYLSSCCSKIKLDPNKTVYKTDSKENVIIEEKIISASRPSKIYQEQFKETGLIVANETCLSKIIQIN